MFRSTCYEVRFNTPTNKGNKMAWLNDPALGAIPPVGEGTVDIGPRTVCGEAARYDGTDPIALINHVGDASLTSFDGKLYRRSDNGSLTPIEYTTEVVIVKPPCGDWYAITADQLMQEFAYCVPTPAPTVADNVVDDGYTFTLPAGATTATFPLGGTVTQQVVTELPMPKVVAKPLLDEPRPKKAAAKAPARKVAAKPK